MEKHFDGSHNICRHTIKMIHISFFFLRLLSFIFLVYIYSLSILFLVWLSKTFISKLGAVELGINIHTYSFFFFLVLMLRFFLSSSSYSFFLYKRRKINMLENTVIYQRKWWDHSDSLGDWSYSLSSSILIFSFSL
jgi:hypothetical protein